MKFNVGDRIKHTITGSEGVVSELRMGTGNIRGVEQMYVRWDHGDTTWAYVDYLERIPQPAENIQMEFAKGDRVKHADSGAEGTVVDVKPYCVRVLWDHSSTGYVKYPPHCLVHIPVNPHPLKIDRTEVASQMRTPNAWAFKYGVSYALTGKFDPLSPKSAELWEEVKKIENQMTDEYATYLELKRKFEGEGK
jgi:hypothetical protein